MQHPDLRFVMLIIAAFVSILLFWKIYNGKFVEDEWLRIWFGFDDDLKTF